MLDDISFSDVLFYSTLTICISIGNYYKHIQDIDTKLNYGTGLGILVAYLICGSHIYFSVIITWGNIIIIKCCDKRYIHQLSLTYTWTYLAYMYYNTDIGSAPYVMWIHQAIALRLVGLAFEMHAAESDNTELLEIPTDSPIKPNILNAEKSEGPSAMRIIAYAYFFIGLHKGPYYRWKMFHDHFETPFGIMGNCRVITEQKLKKAAAYALIFMILRSHFPLYLYHDTKFYETFSYEVRFLYNIPHLVMYYFYHQIIMLLCTSVCTECGFGVYPAQCIPLPGHGPTTKLSLISLATTKTEVALNTEYNFATLRSFDVDKLMFGPRMRDTLRGWDMSTRYWFWAHPYKHFFNAHKEVRKLLSLVAWSTWCGPSMAQLIVASTLWVHCYLESVYCSMYGPDETIKDKWNIGFSFARLFCLIYLAPCLIIQDFETVLKYYNSIYWIYHILLMAFIVVTLTIYNKKKACENVSIKISIENATNKIGTKNVGK